MFAEALTTEPITPLNDFQRAQRGLLGADWRHALAQSLPERVGYRESQRYGQLILQLRRYRDLLAEAGAGHCRTRFPLIHAAAELNAHADQAGQAKLMTLAGVSHEEMSRRLRLEVPVIAHWEAIFFDARSMRPAVDWLARQVVNRARREGQEELAARMKLAIVLGPRAVRALLDADAGAVLDEADRLFQRQIRLHAKFEQALAAPLDSQRAKLTYLKLYIWLRQEEKRLGLARQKLAQHCAQAEQKHELSQFQNTLTLERIRARAEQQQTRQARQQERAQQRQQLKESRRKSAFYRQHAEQLAHQARIAASPLMQLQWGAPAREHPGSAESAQELRQAAAAAASHIPATDDWFSLDGAPSFAEMLESAELAQMA